MTQNPYQKIEILYEDDWILCLDKPANLSTTQTLDPKRPSLEDFVKTQLGYQTIHFPHRLDVGTSGVVLISKQAQGHKKVAGIFELRYAQKIYWAVCQTLPNFWETAKLQTINLSMSSDQPMIFWPDLQLESLAKMKQASYQASIQTLINPFFHETRDQGVDPMINIENGIYQQIDHLGLIAKKPDRYGSVNSGGLKAITTFQYLQACQIRGTTIGHLIEARPKTGRTHQIRVHLSEKNAPIIGDTLYGEAKIAPQWTTAQSKTAQSKTVQSKTAQSKTAQSKTAVSAEQNLLLKAAFLIFPHPFKDHWVCVSAK
jgi:23S rRNA-/tRNA-specific pseudouridylate synthase